MLTKHTHTKTTVHRAKSLKTQNAQEDNSEGVKTLDTYISDVVQTGLEGLGVGGGVLQLDGLAVHLHAGGAIQSDSGQTLRHVRRELQLPARQRAAQTMEVGEGKVDLSTSLAIQLEKKRTKRK